MHPVKMGGRKLDPLPPTERNRPRPTEAEARVRLLDIQMVWDVVIAAGKKPRGARRRAAKKHAVSPATITAAINRFEDAMDVHLFHRGDDGKEILTASGQAFAKHGETFLQSYQILRKFLQNA